MNFINQPTGLISIGIILIMLDMFILGWSTLFFSFFGIGCLVVAGLVFFDVSFVETLTQKIFVVGVIAMISGIIFWLVVKKKSSVQSSPEIGLVGTTFFLKDDIEPNTETTTHFSGVAWKVTSAEYLQKGTRVEIVECQVGRLVVKSLRNAED